jgi:tetratricopeptide (TPR) repeat protein
MVVVCIVMTSSSNTLSAARDKRGRDEQPAAFLALQGPPCRCKVLGMVESIVSGRSLIVAFGAVFLAAAPALAASPGDWAQCRGSDPATAIVSCSLIVSDRDEPAQNRAEAYRLRAGAYIAQGDSANAIADASEAIKLAPQNIAAYISRAQAYFHNGDRDRAVIDFAVAERLDAKIADEFAAASAAFAQIAALARGSASATAAANATAMPGPFCPTGETARDGFVLVNRLNARSQRVHPSNGDVATYEYFEGDERAMSATYYKGLLILFASFLDTYINSYDIDFTRLGDFQVGQEALYHISRLSLDGKVTNAAVERRIVGQEKLSIGECTFDTFVIESQTTFPDGTKTVARSNFSPALRMSLRITSTSDGAEPHEVSFDRVEPLGR